MLKSLVRRTLRLFGGWKLVGDPPPCDRFIMVAAPHTSNWDFPLLLAAMILWDLPMHWLGKRQLFPRPLEGLVRAAGGIPVHRDSRQGLVEQVAEFLHSRDRVVVVVAPEGTRRRADHWRTGFYRMALAAGVPIYCGYIDGANRTFGVGLRVDPTGDIHADFARMAEFYEDKSGVIPRNKGPVRLPEERSL